MPYTCPHCAAENPDAARFCRQCGRAIDEPRVMSTTRVSALLRQWRGLATTMTRRELRRLLGEPKRIDVSVADNLEIWTYEYKWLGDDQDGPPCVRGNVSVSLSELRVLGWCEPDWTG